MAALAVVLGFTRNCDTVQLAATLRQAQRMRGPDEESAWSAPGITLSVCHLFRSASHRCNDHRTDQSMLDCIIAWDGRLDNRDELLGALGLPLTQAVSDAALLAHGWRRWGRALPERLLGDYAFALWDRRDRTLFCARDPVGARPFYYTWQRDFLAIASDDEALIRLPGVSADWHPDRLFYRDNPGFWAFDWQNTWRKDVLILMPGGSLCCDAEGRLLRRRWHRWGPAPECFRGTGEEEADAFGEVFRRAVRDRLRDVETIGVIASGGIDSLGVLTAAHLERAGRTIRQFSVVHDEGLAEIETRSIMLAAERLGLERHWFHVPSMRGAAGREDLERVHAHVHPVDDTIPIIALMSLIARREGSPFLLHGASGDCVLWASDHYIADRLLTGGLRALPECWHEASRAAKHHTYLSGAAIPRIILRALLWRTVPPWFRHLWRLRHDGPFDEPKQLAPGFASGRAQRAACTRRHLRAVLAHERRAWRSPDAEYLDQLQPVGVLRGLEGYQRVAGRYGVDLADPFADLRVIHMARALMNHRTCDGWTKAPLRFWVAKNLDPSDAVFRSDKTHLGWLCARPGEWEAGGEQMRRSTQPADPRP
ncbi:MAG: asparagine synthase-related protein [Casimicrobiaceae bacterium]